ncbi:hypothetical protein PAER4900a_00077 [Pseudomonas phage YMC17/07/R4900a]|nr:hypothetical protein PAER4900a_00077 [Pseudomonas phage YMC17/07/R4900a]
MIESILKQIDLTAKLGQDGSPLQAMNALRIIRETIAKHAVVHPTRSEGERKLSDLGNELHNLSCSLAHDNEEWAEQLSSIARELWSWPQPSPTQAEQHWPKLEQPAKVGGVRFSAGVSSRLVVEAAQRLYKFESTPEKEAERIERLQAFREQLDPFNLAPHAEAFNEAPAEALKPEQAEAERPVVVGYRSGTSGGIYADGYGLEKPEPLMTVAQHDRIVGALRFERQQMDRAFTACINERDAALARIAELEKPDPDYTAPADRRLRPQKGTCATARSIPT